MKSLVSLLLAFAASCSLPILTPKTGPGTDYPCGVHGILCRPGWCCSDTDICGSAEAGSRCPPMECCFEGADEPTFGGRKPTPQWEPK